MRKRHAHADVMSSSYRRNPAWKNGGFTFEAKIPAIPEYSTNASEATVDAQLYERMQGRLASGWYNTILVTTRGNDNWDVKRSYGSQKLTALNEYIVVSFCRGSDCRLLPFATDCLSQLARAPRGSTSETSHSPSSPSTAPTT